jgi:hypothetical protein
MKRPPSLLPATSVSSSLDRRISLPGTAAGESALSRVQPSAAVGSTTASMSGVGAARDRAATCLSKRLLGIKTETDINPIAEGASPELDCRAAKVCLARSCRDPATGSVALALTAITKATPFVIEGAC